MKGLLKPLLFRLCHYKFEIFVMHQHPFRTDGYQLTGIPLHGLLMGAKPGEGAFYPLIVLFGHF